MNIDAVNSSQGDDAMDMRLWEYIDGIADEKERSVIEKLIRENSEWRSKYQDLLEVHQLVQATELEQPSMRFTKKCNGRNIQDADSSCCKKISQ